MRCKLSGVFSFLFLVVTPFMKLPVKANFFILYSSAAHLCNFDIHQCFLKMSGYHVKMLQIQTLLCDQIEMRRFQIFALILCAPAKSIHHELDLQNFAVIRQKPTSPCRAEHAVTRKSISEG